MRETPLAWGARGAGMSYAVPSPDPPPEPPPDPLARAIAAQGEPGFAAAIIDLARARGVPVDHCSVFAFDRELRPALLAAASGTLPEAAQEVSARYADGLYRHDPLREMLGRAGAPPAPILLRLNPEAIPCADYRNTCFRRMGTVDKLALAAGTPGDWATLNLYRREPDGPFRPGEIAQLRTLAPLLGALARKHAALAGRARPDVSAGIFRSRIRALGVALSPREIEVCAMILMGHTSESIALNLGVSHSTVVTFRKRAYAKLGISSANEMFKRVCQIDA